MLDELRRGAANLFAKILLGILIFAFVALWGIGGDLPFRAFGNNAVATVGSTKITSEEFKQAYQDEVQSVARRIGRPLTPEQAQILGIPARALARLIGSAAIDLHAKSLGVTVSDAIVASVIRAQHPELVGRDGRIDMSKYIDIIRQAGYRSIGEYERARKDDLLREQMTETLGAAARPTKFLLDAMHRYKRETRVVEFVSPDFSKLVTIADPPEDRLKTLFEQTQSKYKAPEERKATLLLASRDAVMTRVKVTDDEVKAAYEAAKETYNIPERRRILQLTFPDKAAAEKAYAELSKAKDFNATAAKLGFSANDMQLGTGLLAKADMIDAKIADAAFALKKDELSRPVEGQYSVVLLRVPEIVPGKTRTFDDVKGEIHDQLANERVGQEIQTLHEQVEAGRAKGAPLKEIAAELKLPLQEVTGLTRSGKSGDGKTVINHADAARIAEAVFNATPGVETEVIELSDGGYGWFDLVDVTPERPRTFEEVASQVKASFIEDERRKEIASRTSKLITARKPDEGLEKIAKALNAKIERTGPLKRTDTPPAGVTAAVLQRVFSMPKGAVDSAPTPDGRSRIIFRVGDIIEAPAATAAEKETDRSQATQQLRVDLLDQYVGGLRARFGITVNEKLLAQALGTSSE